MPNPNEAIPIVKQRLKVIFLSTAMYLLASGYISPSLSVVNIFVAISAGNFRAHFAQEDATDLVYKFGLAFCFAHRNT